MRSRLLFFVILLILLFVLSVEYNKKIRNHILDFVIPLKSDYRQMSERVERAGDSYIFQKETIKKLRRENRKLKKYLLDQTNYLRQISIVYKKLPTLERLPYKSIMLVDTLSYVKLNKFDTILLSKPMKSLEEKRVYGLIQNEVVAGIAKEDNGKLFGYLISSPECRFGVYVGPKRIPGIAVGVDKSTMEVRFIPKWADIKVGDRVETNGLDGIFFANMPVGVVKEVSIEGSYKKAYIVTYADTIHPDLFFLVTDPKPYLASYYDQNESFPNDEYAYEGQPPLEAEVNLSSIPVMIQTKELEIDPGEFEIPREEEKKPPLKVINSKKKKKKRRIYRPKADFVNPVVKSEKESMKESTKESTKVQILKKDEKPKHPSPFDILRVDPFD